MILSGKTMVPGERSEDSLVGWKLFVSDMGLDYTKGSIQSDWDWVVSNYKMGNWLIEDIKCWIHCQALILSLVAVESRKVLLVMRPLPLTNDYTSILPSPHSQLPLRLYYTIIDFPFNLNQKVTDNFKVVSFFFFLGRPRIPCLGTSQTRGRLPRREVVFHPRMRPKGTRARSTISDQHGDKSSSVSCLDPSHHLPSSFFSPFLLSIITPRRTRL